MLRRRHLITTICLLLLTGLALSAEQAPKSASDYWPFREGNTWTVDTKIGDKRITQVITVTKVTANDGKTRAQVEYKSNGNATQLETYEVDANSISRVSSGPGGTNKLTPPLPVVQFPLTDGKKWNWKGQIVNGNAKPIDGTAQLAASGPEEIKTEAGTFSAMRVHLDLEISAGQQKMKVANDYWFAPNVGLIKQSTTIAGQVIEGVVSSYKLAK